MKKVNKQIVTFVLLIVTTISAIFGVISVNARDIKKEYQKGDIKDNTGTQTDGSIKNEGDVEFKKIVSPSGEEGIYDVTLKVKGKDINKVSTKVGTIYAVVVLDRSNSMKDNNRWSNAVSGAKTFATTLKKNYPGDASKLALVEFSGLEGDGKYNDAKVIRKFSQSNFSTIYFGIPNGGTNLEAGLYEAKNLLDNVTEENALKYIVVIGDGVPTFYYDDEGKTDGEGSGYDSTAKEHANNKADELKNSGVKIFSIGYDVDENSTAEKVLKGISSNTKTETGYYVNANPTTIANAFTNIAESIKVKVPAGTKATITDVIAEGFTYVDGSANPKNATLSKDKKTISFKVDNITEEGKTVSFKIKKNDILNSKDDWYKTNDEAEVKYDEGSKKITDSAKVYWPLPKYSYEINYYKDSIAATNKLGKSIIGIDTLGKTIEVNENKELPIGYKEITKNYDFKITSGKNIVNIVYVKDENQKHELSYTVEYYIDGKIQTKDTEIVKENVWINDKTLTVNKTAINTKDKYTGYKFSKSEPATIPSKIEDKGVIKVYYVKDENQKHELSYTVNYYIDGVIQTKDTQTVTKNVWINDKTLTVNKTTINTKDKYTGYKFSKSEPAEIPSKIEDNGVIKVYYVKDENQKHELSYTVNYYIDGVIQTKDTEIVKEKVWINEDTLRVIATNINTKDKYVGYKFDHSTPTNIPVRIKDNGIINIYYVKDVSQTKELHYTVEYYKNNILQEPDTEIVTKTVWINDSNKIRVIATNINVTDKYTGYKCVSPKITDIPSSVESGEVIKVYYNIRKDYKYTVKYLEKGTNKELADSVIRTKKTYNKVYREKALDLTENGYKLVGSKIQKVRTNKNNKVVIFLYEKRTDYKYTVKYLEKGTNKELADSVLRENKTFNEIYEEKALDLTKLGYKLVDDGNKTIKLDENNKTLVFYYAKRTDIKYTVNYLDKETNKVIATSKVGKATLDEIIKAKDEVIQIIGYDFENANPEMITISVDASKNVINLYYITALGEVIPEGNVNIEYVDSEGNKIIDPETITGEVDTEFNVDKKEIPGYKLVEVKGELTGKFTEENQKITFVYEKVPFTGVNVNNYEPMIIASLVSLLGLLILKSKKFN